MTPTGWIMIGTTAASLIAGWIFWLVRRRVTRLDALENAVFGDNGMRVQLHKYVTQDQFQRELAALGAAMRGISEEGQKREERILKAIENQTLVVGSEVREVKAEVRDQLREVRADVRAQGERVDKLLVQQTPQR